MFYRFLIKVRMTKDHRIHFYPGTPSSNGGGVSSTSTTSQSGGLAGLSLVNSAPPGQLGDLNNNHIANMENLLLNSAAAASLFNSSSVQELLNLNGGLSKGVLTRSNDAAVSQNSNQFLPLSSSSTPPSSSSSINGGGATNTSAAANTLQRLTSHSNSPDMMHHPPHSFAAAAAAQTGQNNTNATTSELCSSDLGHVNANLNHLLSVSPTSNNLNLCNLLSGLSSNLIGLGMLLTIF